MHHPSEAITDDLHFDMPCLGNKLLYKDVADSEGCSSFGLTSGPCILQIARVTDDSDPASTAPGECLDHEHAVGAERIDEGMCLIERRRLGCATQQWNV